MIVAATARFIPAGRIAELRPNFPAEAAVLANDKANWVGFTEFMTAPFSALPIQRAPCYCKVAIQFQSRDIVLHRRNEQLQRVSEFHRTYDAIE